MKLYIVRHGESVNNVSGLWTGWMDTPLTEKGTQDALRARPYLTGISFDKVYSSDLQRAYHTGLLALPGCEPEKLPILREIDVGSLAGTPLFSNASQQTAYDRYLGYEEFGGESYKTFSDRTLQFLSMLEQLDVQTVVAFSHGGYLQMLLNNICGQTISRKAIQCKNCAIAVFEYSKNQWSLHSWINTQ